MIVHTAHWRLSDVTMSCGHTLSVRSGEASAFCPWCAQTVGAAQAA